MSVAPVLIDGQRRRARSAGVTAASIVRNASVSSRDTPGGRDVARRKLDADGRIVDGLAEYSSTVVRVVVRKRPKVELRFRLGRYDVQR